MGSVLVSLAPFTHNEPRLNPFPPWMELETMRGAHSPQARAGTDVLRALGWGKKEQGWCLEAGVPERGKNKSAWVGGC